MGVKKLFNIPVQLVLIFAFTLFLGYKLPLFWQQTFYSLSLTIKSILLFVLPFVIFSLLFSSIVKLSGRAFWLLLLLIPALSLSNFITTMFAYAGGINVLDWINLNSQILDNIQHELQPLWQLNLPKLCSNQTALLTSFLMAVVFILKDKIFINQQRMTTIVAAKLEKFAEIVLSKGFIPVVPIFMLGFLLKLQYDGSLAILMKNYAYVFLAVVGVQFVYILFLYSIASNFRVKRILLSIKNMLPAAATAFATMSSAAALPLVLKGSEKNTQSPENTRVIVPVTINIHLVGDCISIPIFALAILQSYGYPIPDLATYLIFSLYFVIAKFAVAAVPGGGVLVMIPILQQYLNFNAEMVSLITALYILSDSVTTSFNTLGNGAFSIIISKLRRSLAKIRFVTQKEQVINKY